MRRLGLRIVAACSVIAVVMLGRAEPPPAAPLLGGDEPSTPMVVLHGNQAGKGAKGDVFCAAFSPDGGMVATGSSDGKVRCWNPATGKWMGNLDSGALFRITAVAFLPDGKSLAAASVQNIVYIWDLTDKSLTTTLTPKGTTDFAHLQVCMAVAPKGHGIATGAEDGILHLFDASKGKETAAVKTDSDLIWDIAYSPDGKTLATAEGNQAEGHASDFTRPVGEIVLRDPATGGMHLVINTGAPVRSIAFSPDGKFIASNGKNVTLWDVKTTQPMAYIKQRYHAQSVAFSNKGKLGASGDADTTVRVWKPTDGTMLAVFKLDGRVSDVLKVVFSPDDTLVASVVHSDVQLWDVSSLSPKPATTQKTATTQKAATTQQAAPSQR